ncbi:hypothetical protein PENTCL1PPCAC_5272, partial [Pristionchus entomophagus]
LVPSKRLRVLIDPLQCRHLVPQAIVAGTSCLTGSHESEIADSVVNRDEEDITSDDILADVDVSKRHRVSDLEGTTVDKHHYGEA